MNGRRRRNQVLSVSGRRRPVVEIECQAAEAGTLHELTAVDHGPAFRSERLQTRRILPERMAAEAQFRLHLQVAGKGPRPGKRRRRFCLRTSFLRGLGGELLGKKLSL